MFILRYFLAEKREITNVISKTTISFKAKGTGEFNLTMHFYVILYIKIL